MCYTVRERERERERQKEKKQKEDECEVKGRIFLTPFHSIPFDSFCYAC